MPMLTTKLVMHGGESWNRVQFLNYASFEIIDVQVIMTSQTSASTTPADQPPASASSTADQVPADDQVKEEPVSLKGFFSDTVVYSMVDVIDKGVGFILMLVLSYFVNDKGYGLLGIYGNVMQVLALFVGTGTQTTLFRYYIKAKGDADRKRILSTSLWLASVNGLIWVAIFLAVSPWIGSYIFEGSAEVIGAVGSDGKVNQDKVRSTESWMVIAVSCAAFLDLATSLGIALLQADGKRWTFLAIEVLHILLVRFTAFGLIIFGYGVWGWIIAQIVGQIITAILMKMFAFEGWTRQFDKKLAWELYWYGLSLMPMALSHWIMRGCDSIMIKKMAVTEDIGFSEAGFYSIGNRISSVMDFVGMAFNLGWRRFAFKNIDHEDGPRLMARGMTLFTFIGGYIALGLMVLGDDLLHWLINPEFSRGLEVIPALTFASLMWGLSNIVETALYTHNRVNRLAMLNIGAALLNVLLNWILIPRLGISGAAIATAISQSLKFVLVWWQSYLARPIPYEFGRLAVIGVSLTITFLVASCLSPQLFAGAAGPGTQSWILSTGSQALLLALWPLVIFIPGFLTLGEKAMLQTLLRRVISVVTFRVPS